MLATQARAPFIAVSLFLFLVFVLAGPRILPQYDAELTRLAGDRGDVFGTLPQGIDTAAILDRVTPKIG